MHQSITFNETINYLTNNLKFPKNLFLKKKKTRSRSNISDIARKKIFSLLTKLISYLVDIIESSRPKKYHLLQKF